MPSWQSYMLDPCLRFLVKRNLKGITSPAAARGALEKSAFPLPKGAMHRPGSMGGISGEWLRGKEAPAGKMLYLHGGGYFSCSPATHRAITGALANHGFEVFAADYRLAPHTTVPRSEP